MKRSILKIAILVSGLFVTSMFVTGCGGKKESTEEHEHTAGDSTGHHHDEMDSTKMHSMDSTQMEGHAH